MKAEDALLSRVDPRARVVGAVLFVIAVVEAKSVVALSAAFVLAVVLMALAGLPWRRTFRRMAAVDGFILFLLVSLPFTVPGDAWITVFGYPASREGVRLAIEIALTANAAILALMALAGSMEAVTLGHALIHLRVPESLVQLLMFTVRYIDVLGAEYRRLCQAMKARGFRLRTGIHTYRSLGYLIGMILVRAVERAERILDAMKCRGFTGRFPVIDQFRYSGADAVFAFTIVGVCAALWALEVWVVAV